LENEETRKPLVMLPGFEINNWTCTSPASSRCVKTSIFRKGLRTGALYCKQFFI